MKKILITSFLLGCLFAFAQAKEIHVSIKGDDANDGSAGRPLKTIMAAANKAMPGDVITVHAGIYREEIIPPRGGTSNSKRITYQAAKGEKVTITGSNLFKTWEKVSNDTWKLTIPNASFGEFNPYVAMVYGGWFDSKGRTHRRGNIYVNGEWIPEAPNLDSVKAGQKSAWFSVVDGLVEKKIASELVHLASIKIGNNKPIPAYKPTETNSWRCLPNAKEANHIIFIASNCWMTYDKVDFGAGSESISLNAAAIPEGGGTIELRDGMFDGPLLGTCEVLPTGDWKAWKTFTAKIKRTAGVRKLSLIIKSKVGLENELRTKVVGGNTTIYAKFPGAKNPNDGSVEVCMRPSVFSPAKTNINFITLRGFDLRNAATNWASPSVGQKGLVSAYWNKGWIIEDNEISYSRCSGIALGKYSDEWDGHRSSTEGYYHTIEDAYKKDGWNKATIGSHLVRNNTIHHCGQAGIVGSLGAVFSTIEGNEIHDIAAQNIWGGAEMAGIKFHAAIDVVIKDNHIHNCAQFGGIWFDWMAQGTIVTGNLLHDNWQDLFTEVDHGPFLIANNIFLSDKMQRCDWGGSQGGAFAHNFIGGFISRFRPDARKTQVLKPHSTEVVDIRDNPVGDVRWYNNILAGPADLSSHDDATLPCAWGGNVFTKGSKKSKFEQEFLDLPNFNTNSKLVKKADGWYLVQHIDPSWATQQKRKLVTTELLGKAIIPNQAFEQPDGTAFILNTDYFGNKRNTANPFPGAFETPISGEVKVWPKLKNKRN